MSQGLVQSKASGGDGGDCLKTRNASDAGLMRGVRLIKRSAHDMEELFMQLTFAIEASQSRGVTFRLALGITIPFGLVMAVLSLAGLS